MWSRNCPHVQPHCEIRSSEKMFWNLSLKMRLLTSLVFGPETGWLWPSAYRAGRTRV